MFWVQDCGGSSFKLWYRVMNGWGWEKFKVTRSKKVNKRKPTLVFVTRKKNYWDPSTYSTCQSQCNLCSLWTYLAHSPLCTVTHHPGSSTKMVTALLGPVQVLLLWILSPLSSWPQSNSPACKLLKHFLTTAFLAFILHAWDGKWISSHVPILVNSQWLLREEI